MFNKNYKSVIELIKAFPDEVSCITYLEKIRWNGNIVSPFDPESKVYEVKNNNYICKNTKKYFNVKTNTIFHSTNISLQKWFVAIWLFTSHKNGISSVQLSKDIGVTQKTAWKMLQKIRACFESDDDENNKLTGTVEIDETFVGGKNKNRHKRKKIKQSRNREWSDKIPIIGMLQRGGRLIARQVENVKAYTLNKYINKFINADVIYTDEWRGYAKLGQRFVHKVVKHGYGQYVIGDCTTNSIEGFWSILKRSYHGTYHHVSRKHIQGYINEWVYRFNTRFMSESERFINALMKCLAM